jgi:hypothetical protein
MRDGQVARQDPHSRPEFAKPRWVAKRRRFCRILPYLRRRAEMP